MEDILLADAPRVPCPSCAREHLGEATIVLQESLQGYPENRWLGVAFVRQAEAEIQGLFPDIATRLRATRKKMMKTPGKVASFMPFVTEITDRVGDRDCAAAGCKTCDARSGRRLGRISTRIAAAVAKESRRCR